VPPQYVRPTRMLFFVSIKIGLQEALPPTQMPVEARVMAVVHKPLSINSFIAKSGPPPSWKHLSVRGTWFRRKTR